MLPTISIVTSPATKADILVVPVMQGQKDLPLPAAARRGVAKRLKEIGFTGAWGTGKLLAVRERGVAAAWLGVIGLGGTKESPDRAAESVRRAVARIIQQARRHGLKTVVIDFRSLSQVPTLAQAAVEGAVLANYRFTQRSKRLQEQDRRQATKKLVLLVESTDQNEVRRVVRETQRILTGVLLTRRLINEPAGHMTPKVLVDEARALVTASQAMTVKIMDRAAATRANFPAFLAVAQGSHEEPYVIHLQYTPKMDGGQPPKKVFLIGKGITFDSGGLSLKPPASMEDMKLDMAGAATVLGVFAALQHTQLPLEVHGVIAACENMPSGTAYRPGDVIATRSGTTIEVITTDAEGRLALADCLTYAAEHKPDVMIDVATLSGAMMAGLGDTVAGLLSNDESVLERLTQAFRETGEQAAVLPMPEEYRSYLESNVADLRNVAPTRYGDGIIAALFLENFVQGRPWAHLDIAGPAHAAKSPIPYWGGGASGFGVRTLVQFLKHFSRA